jgi:predicted dienelactone hydrolase
MYCRLTLIAACLIGCVAAAAAPVAAEQTVSLAGMKVEAWEPEAATGAVPVIVFSHGFHGCATQSRFLASAFSAAGYAVFAANHRDAGCDGGEASMRDGPQMPFQRPESWSEATYRDRADDIRRLIDALKQDARWRGRLDWSHLGLAGHSLGGYTMLGLGGAWPGWRLDGVKAVLALSPYAQPFIVQHTLADVDAPVMYQGGGYDFAITPFLRRAEGGYDQTPAPKYYVEFDRAGHLAWTDLGEDHQAIIAYSLAFMDHYVKGLPAAAVLSHALAGVRALRYDSELGTHD